jgi:hypothetical protein
VDEAIKTGKKRRSAPEIPQNIRSGSWLPDLMPIMLQEVFNNFEEKFENQLSDALENDLLLARKVIMQIENRVWQRIYKKFTGGGYSQDEIYCLGSIMAKAPLIMGVNFVDYQSIIKKSEKYKYNTTQDYQEMKTKVRVMEKKKELFKIIISPYAISLGEGKHNRQEAGVRNALTLGIFDYLERLSMGNGSGRVRLCPECDEWFISKRINNFTCGKQLCYERHWRKERGGKSYRKNKMKAKRIKDRLEKLKGQV